MGSLWWQEATKCYSEDDLEWKTKIWKPAIWGQVKKHTEEKFRWGYVQAKGKALVFIGF